MRNPKQTNRPSDSNVKISIFVAESALCEPVVMSFYHSPSIQNEMISLSVKRKITVSYKYRKFKIELNVIRNIFPLVCRVGRYLLCIYGTKKCSFCR